MPTQEMPDNELDDLFRKAAGEYNAEFEPEAWKRMEQLLDERDGRTGSYWWKGILLTVVLLLVGTLGVVLLRKPEGTSGSTVTENRQPAAAPTPAGGNRSADGNAGPERNTAGQNDSGGERARTEKLENGKAGTDRSATDGKGVREPPAPTGQTAGKKAATESAKSEEVDKKDAGREVTPEKAGGNTSPDRSPTGAGNRENTPDETTGTARKRVPGGVTAPPVGVRPGVLADLARRKQERPTSRGEGLTRTETGSGNNSPGATGGTSERNPPGELTDKDSNRGEVALVPGPGADQENAFPPAGARLPELAFLTAKLLVATKPELGRPVVPPPAAREKKPIEPVAKPQRPTARLSAGVMVSPDLSSIGLSGRLTPGTNAGVQLEYRLTNRFRVGVGAIYSVKLYSAKVEDYKVPYGFWTYGVKPSGIDANCKILDLPVHLRFDALRRARYNAFVSTGLSSYIMLSERYGYSYPTYNPSLRPAWHGERTGEHYFSVVNLSVGYERNLGRRFSWQAEPFLKLPLGGVGFGKVRLGSSGVFVSVKYKIGKP
jgi:hypothetical protein